MAKEYIGESKTVLKILGFLNEEYGMKFHFQSFDVYMGFRGPINTYSFYNDHGCFTLHHVVQRGEWGWYVSSKIHTNLCELLTKEIRQSDYIQHSTISYKNHLKMLAAIIRKQVESSQQFFGIIVNTDNNSDSNPNIDNPY